MYVICKNYGLRRRGEETENMKLYVWFRGGLEEEVVVVVDGWKGASEKSKPKMMKPNTGGMNE